MSLWDDLLGFGTPADSALIIAAIVLALQIIISLFKEYNKFQRIDEIHADIKTTEDEVITSKIDEISSTISALPSDSTLYPSIGEIRTIISDAINEHKDDLFKPVADNFQLYVRKYNELAIKQANWQFGVSLFGAVIGFIWIIYSAARVEINDLATLFNILPGVVMESVSFLFFQQQTKSREMSTAYFDRLREDEEIKKAIELVEKIQDNKTRSETKSKIVLRLAGLEIQRST